MKFNNSKLKFHEIKIHENNISCDLLSYSVSYQGGALKWVVRKKYLLTSRNINRKFHKFEC